MSRALLEKMVREIGGSLQESLPKHIGFGLFFFDFGDAGNLAYISNAEREDMVAALYELVAQLEANADRRAVLATLKNTVADLEQSIAKEG